jgi:vacuolar-type H+-ATPase subunit H
MMVQNNPIEQVREKERVTNQQRLTAERACESIIHKAHEEAHQLQVDAIRRGQQSGQKAYDQALEKAQAAAAEHIAAVKAQVAEMTGQSGALVQQSVEWALTLVLPDESGGA